MPPSILLKLDGAKELMKALKKQEGPFLQEMAAVLPEEGRALMDTANAAAPRATGALAASSSVTTVVQPSKGRVRVAAAYLDEKAAAVHEGVHWGRHLPGTKGFKFYERAMNAFEPGFLGRVAARLKRLVGGGK